MNWKPKNPAANSSPDTLARTSAPLRKRPRRTSGEDEARSMRTNARKRSRAAPIVPTVRAAGMCVARSTPKTSSRIPAVTATAPARSTPCPARSGRGEAGTSASAARRMPNERMTGAKNTQRQSMAESSPPTTRPIEKPPAAVPA